MGSKSNGKRCPDQGAAAQAGEVRNTITANSAIAATTIREPAIGTITNNGPLISTRSMPAWLVLEVRLGKSPGDEQGLASLRRLCDLMSRKGPAYLCPDNGRLKWFKPDPDQ